MLNIIQRMPRPVVRVSKALVVVVVVGIMAVLDVSAVLARDDLTSVAVLVTAAGWIPLQLITAALYRRP
ncbi:hypothetical protein [Micromonospora chersina]|uniref:hypothetical protein n=1 Tax=Micromonospora chersina TaxID=47854 RepID=UPI003D8C7C66